MELRYAQRSQHVSLNKAATAARGCVGQIVSLGGGGGGGLCCDEMTMTTTIDHHSITHKFVIPHKTKSVLKINPSHPNILQNFNDHKPQPPDFGVRSEAGRLHLHALWFLHAVAFSFHTSICCGAAAFHHLQQLSPLSPLPPPPTLHLHPQPLPQRAAAAAHQLAASLAVQRIAEKSELKMSGSGSAS